MTITSVGYAGTITDANWRRMATAAVGSVYGADDPASWRVSTGVGDRALQVAPGGIFGLGVRDFSDAPVTLTAPAVPSGSRWDMVVARRNWNTKQTTLELIQGSAAKALPERETGFGTQNDQPLALVRFAAGQTAAQDIIDLRCIPGDGAMIAFDTLARSYLDSVGTSVRVGNYLWTRSVNASGSLIWLFVDVTPDTGWVEVPRNPDWVWGSAFHARRVGSQISVRLAADRAIGWSMGNNLTTLPSAFWPDVAWFVPSSSTTGKTEFVIYANGVVLASQNAAGATGVTIHTTYPASRPF